MSEVWATCILRSPPSFNCCIFAHARREVAKPGANSELLRVAYCDGGRYVTCMIILVFQIIKVGE
jgi:hypothetical protein